MKRYETIRKEHKEGSSVQLLIKKYKLKERTVYRIVNGK